MILATLDDLIAPEACCDLGDVRRGIDALDAAVIALLGRRMGYVKAASAFKPDEESIPAPERVAAMLVDRRAWATEAGLDPDYVATLFAGISEWFIQQQILHWRATRGEVA